MIRIFLSALIGFAIILNAFSANSENLGIRIVSSLDIKRPMDGGIRMFIIDVRSEKEFKNGHIKNAMNLPLEQLNEKSLSRIIKDKNERVIFYSDSNESTKSLTASERAVLFGYKKVYRYTAGYKAWEDAGFPVIKFIKD